MWIVDLWRTKVYTRPLLVTYKDLSSERIGALGLAVGNEANQKREHASYRVASEYRPEADVNGIARE